MKNRIKLERHEYTYGPHFNESCAKEAVVNMQNEDGTTGAHWSLDETTQLANQYNVDLHDSFNKYDWFVALNMIRSDFYKVIVNMSNSDHAKHFVEFAKAWLEDKDVEEGKMWYYYKYIMCNNCEDYDDERRYVKSYRRAKYDYDDDDDYEYRYREPRYERRSRYY